MNIELSQIIQDGVFAAIASMGFAVISNPPKKAVSVSIVLACIGHGFRFYLLHYTSLDLATATLFAAFTIGMLSIFFAKIIHCPAEVFSFPSLLPMIPGMFAYKMILSLIKFLHTNDTILQQSLIVEIFKNGLTVVFVMFALVIGVSVPLFVFHKQSFMMTRLINPIRKFKK